MFHYDVNVGVMQFFHILLFLCVTLYYCQNHTPLSLNTGEVPDSQLLIVSDFNSHSQAWGYADRQKR